jgi:hypothetical protein
MITTIMAGFAFGYCVMDIIRNIQAERRINELLRETVERDYD